MKRVSDSLAHNYKTSWITKLNHRVVLVIIFFQNRVPDFVSLFISFFKSFFFFYFTSWRRFIWPTNVFSQDQLSKSSLIFFYSQQNLKYNKYVIIFFWIYWPRRQKRLFIYIFYWLFEHKGVKFVLYVNRNQVSQL